MQEVGEVVHLASSGRVIIQLVRPVEEGTILCDKSSGKVARVMELIGPVAKPYASAMPLTNNIKKYTGAKVFAFEDTPAKKQKTTWRKKR